MLCDTVILYHVSHDFEEVIEFQYEHENKEISSFPVSILIMWTFSKWGQENTSALLVSGKKEKKEHYA